MTAGPSQVPQSRPKTGPSVRPVPAEFGDGVGLPRLAWIDNVRTGVIAAVIVAHVATAYVLHVDWYYEERTANPITEAVLALAILPAGLFVMALLFLVAGMLSQRSLARKGPGRFLIGRMWRLGVPLILYVVVIGPLTSLVGQRAEGNPAATHAAAFLLEEVKHPETGPMWFVFALAVFTIAYAGLSLVRPSDRFRSVLRPRHLLAAGGLVAVGSFAVRLVWPFASDTPLGLNLFEWPQMLVMFGFGTLAAERGWLAEPPGWLRRVCGLSGLIGVLGLVVLGVVVVASGSSAFLGGWHVEAMAEPVFEAVVAVSMSLWAVLWFAEHVAFDSTLSRALAYASYPAYVLHPPVVVLLSAALSSLAVIAELKFVFVSVIGVAVSFTIGWLISNMLHRIGSWGHHGVALAR